jgi:predicted alpha/beta hydrolase family esterase
MNDRRVLILPGWQGSGPGHWQMRWVNTHGYSVVEQHDWLRPLRGDWLIRLEEAVLDAPAGVVLVAHSLGCIQVAAWAAHSQNTARVKAALLVAPGDVESPTLREKLHSWTPIARQRLPFKSILVGSENDPYCPLDTARQLALDWGSQWVNQGTAGHVNAESKLGDWLQGQSLLNELLKD